MTITNRVIEAVPIRPIVMECFTCSLLREVGAGFSQLPRPGREAAAEAAPAQDADQQAQQQGAGGECEHHEQPSA
jgi:hypothetical protein